MRSESHPCGIEIEPQEPTIAQRGGALNRTLVVLKFRVFGNELPVQLSLNRTLVVLKYGALPDGAPDRFALNRTLVVLKLLIRAGFNYDPKPLNRTLVVLKYGALPDGAPDRFALNRTLVVLKLESLLEHETAPTL